MAEEPQDHDYDDEAFEDFSDGEGDRRHHHVGTEGRKDVYGLREEDRQRQHHHLYEQAQRQHGGLNQQQEWAEQSLHGTDEYVWDHRTTPQGEGSDEDEDGGGSTYGDDDDGEDEEEGLSAYHHILPHAEAQSLAASAANRRRRRSPHRQGRSTMEAPAAVVRHTSSGSMQLDHPQSWSRGNSQHGGSTSAASIINNKHGSGKNLTFKPEQLHGMERENERLLDSMVRIHNRGLAGTFSLNQQYLRGGKRMASTTINRQKQAREIQRANQMMAMRLESIKPTVSNRNKSNQTWRIKPARPARLVQPEWQS